MARLDLELNPGSASSEFVLAVDPTSPPPRLRKAVYAVGNFDGVHLGHRAVIERTKALARARGAPSAVLTFEPHPADFFAGRPVVFRLTPFAAKAGAIRSLGVDGGVFLTFDATLAALSAEAFVEDILVRSLDIGAAVVGWDFHFGKGRSGSPAFLQAAGERLGFDVDVIAKVEASDPGGHEVISSSTVRSALERGDVAAAAARLGRPYAVTGVVIGGQKLGRTLGVPTANIALEPTNRLAHGVYAVRAEVDGRTHDGVASFGVRPTVDNGAPLLETYLFDFDADVYGHEMRVEFIERIRPELKFDSLEALKAEMTRDLARARAILTA
jgi:riboflavin kinase/FMN adenylyltransferase